jgi:anti-anti-sigma factor
LNISNTNKNGILILNVEGRLDANTSGEFEKKVFEFINSGSKMMILDFSNLVYISSAGLRVIILTVKKINSLNGKLILCSLKPQIMEVLEIAGFTGILVISKNSEEALLKF